MATQAQRKAETRSRLLDAAADLFARRGFHATSTDALADAADRTSGAVYAHFGGKEGLLIALVDAWEQRVAGVLGEALADTTTGAERRAAIWRHVAHPDGEAADRWLLLEHELLLLAAREPELGALLARRYAGGRSAMGAAFEGWADDDGSALPVDGRDLATLVLALLLGLEVQRRIDPAAVPDALAEQGLALLFADASPAAPTVDPDPPARGGAGASARRSVRPTRRSRRT